MKSLLTLTILAALWISLPQREINAAIIVVAPTSTTAGNVTITDDITFSIIISDPISSFILHNWVISDGGQNGPSLSPNLSFSINTTLHNSYDSYLIDNVTPLGNPSNGHLGIISGPSVMIGDTVTLHAGTYTINPFPDFNPLANQTFTGDMFIVNGFGQAISGVVAVPEPASLILLLSGAGLTLAIRRSRRR